MTLDLGLALKIANMQTNFVIVFQDDNIVLTNNSFNTFFGVSSLEEYLESFGDFIKQLCPTPIILQCSKNRRW